MSIQVTNAASDLVAPIVCVDRLPPIGDGPRDVVSGLLLERDKPLALADLDRYNHRQPSCSALGDPPRTLPSPTPPAKVWVDEQPDE
jgi:hypothetical protein